MMSGKSSSECGFFGFDELISVYTRAQAIEDGVLIDVTETAKEKGFKIPVAVTSNLWASWIVPSAEAKRYKQEATGRLWDVLTMFHHAIGASKTDFVKFTVLFADAPHKRRYVELWGKIHGGDQGEPVITIMLPGDD
jgi:hypothetical protein